MRLKSLIRPALGLVLCLVLPAFGPAAGDTLATADRVVVKKSERRMYLLRDGARDRELQGLAWAESRRAKAARRRLSNARG